jgi:hypothetical protein
MLDSKVAEYGGEMLYINKSATKPVWAMEYSRDEGARQYQDDFTAAVPQGQRPTITATRTATRSRTSALVGLLPRAAGHRRPRQLGRRQHHLVRLNTHFRGDNNYRRSGEVDAVRLPKEGFYAHQVMWDDWVDERHAAHAHHRPLELRRRHGEGRLRGLQRRQRRAVPERPSLGQGAQQRLPVHVEGRDLGAGDAARRGDVTPKGKSELLVEKSDRRVSR